MSYIPQKANLRSVTRKDLAFRFILGIIFNQGIRAEMAWQAPATLFERLDRSDPTDISRMDVGAIAAAIGESPSLHRYVKSMAKYVFGASSHICSSYDGDARRIWCGAPSAEEVFHRLTAIPGIGSHKANVAICLLNADFGVPFRDDSNRLEAAFLACPNLRKHGRMLER